MIRNSFKIILPLLFLFYLLLGSISISTAQNLFSPYTGQKSGNTFIDKSNAKIQVALTPSEWLQTANNQINELLLPAFAGLDSTQWNDEFERLREHDNVISQIILSSSERGISLKELSDLESQSRGIEYALMIIQEDISKVSNTFTDYHRRATALTEESFNKTLLNDTTLRDVYIDELNEIKRSSDTLRRYFASHLDVINTKQKENRTLILQNGLMHLTIKEKIKEEQRKFTTQDEPVLWNIFAKSYSDYSTVLYNSYSMLYFSLTTYFAQTWSKKLPLKLFLILIAFLPLIYLKYLTRKGRQGEVEMMPLNYLNKYPVQICLIYMFALIQLSLEYPPLILNQLIYLFIVLITSLIVFKEFVGKELKAYYIIIFVYYLLIKLSDFISQISPAERILYALSIVPIYLTIKNFSKFTKDIRRNQNMVKFLMIFFLAHLITGFLLNVLGRVALSKIIISSGMNALYVGLFLMIAIYAILDYLYLMISFYNSFTPKFLIDIETVRTKILRLLWFFAIIFWVVTYLVDLNSLMYIYEKLSAFLSVPRKLGSIEFSLGTILIFNFVLYLSFYISGLMKDLIEVKHTTSGNYDSGNSGGFLLIVRLFIVGFGFLIALAASGMPIDKLTILISALSVGIGFGLQSIVNNLVSGVIIAVEKPFKIGDLVEVNGVAGRVRELSIRSSIITTTEGSEMIVPNGELISKTLINWTMNNNSKKEIINLELETSTKDNDVHRIIVDSVESVAVFQFISNLNINIVSYSTAESQSWSVDYRISVISRSSEIKSKLILAIKRNLEQTDMKVIKIG
ncbi:MAG: mechanosensitive ion channel [Ignavibacteria bacterium]|nr:mechanosensitive ion channel [Ignavibacteria bacterium]